MAPHCCVPQCTSSHRKKSYRGQTFHRFPNDQGIRQQWIKNIRRDPGCHFKIHAYTKVCSEHFLPDCFVKTQAGITKRITKLEKGAVPTVFAWSSSNPDRRMVVRTASNVSTDLDDQQGANVLSEQTPPPHPDHDYALLPPPGEYQLEEARRKISEHEMFVVSNFIGDDKAVSFYTGFPDFLTFKAVFMALQPTADTMVGWSQEQRLKHTGGEVLRQGFSSSKLSLMEQFFLFLCRLRQGFPEQDLATRYHISQSTVSRICVTWVNFLYYMLGSLQIWPSRTTVNELMPACFQNTYPDTRVILDCTEIHVQKPSSEVLNSAIYSLYKSNTTFKALIGISPSGEVTFVSDLYTGSISDKEITKISGILSLLEEGDMVMADEGFLIKDLLSEKNVSLVIPPSLGPSGHFSADEVQQTQAIARLRIHVERAIRRIKEYHIFDKVLPMTLVGSVNQLWAVCAILTNFQGPLF